MPFLIDRFAAHLAHLLNDPDEPVRVDPGRLYATLTATLAGQPYRDQLLYQPSYAWRMDAEEAATRYFAATLERRLWLSGGVERSVAHRLFEALCQRGVDSGWSNAALVRQPTARQSATVVPLLSLDQRRVLDALRTLPNTLSPGNGATRIREQRGPLRLVFGATAVTVAEEFSLWDAIRCAPSPLAPLRPGEPFNRFCGVVIDALRTANRPVQEVLGLNRGLCPFDWLEDLPVNQARGWRRFLKQLPEDGPDTPEHWTAAWSVAKVPGYRDVQALWDSPLGRALRLRGRGSPLVETDAPGEAEPDESPELLDRRSFAAELAELVGIGRIDSRERALLLALYDGAALHDTLIEQGLDRELKRRDLNLTDYVTDLNERIQTCREDAMELPNHDYPSRQKR